VEWVFRIFQYLSKLQFLIIYAHCTENKNQSCEGNAYVPQCCGRPVCKVCVWLLVLTSDFASHGFLMLSYNNHAKYSCTSKVTDIPRFIACSAWLQVQLQNLMTSKYIAHFLEEVSGWVQKLSTADSVLSIWLEVQRTWSHLESIFIGSEDIRSQLPEDSKRFDIIDKDFKGFLLC